MARCILMAIVAMGYCIGYAKGQTAVDSSSAAVSFAGQQKSGMMKEACDTVRREAADAANSEAAADSAAADTAKLYGKHRAHSFFELGMSYQSNDVYLGRKNTSTLPYFVPAINYYHRSGLFAGASLDYLKTSDVSRVDLFTIDAGYLFTAHRYDGVLTLSKYFYNSQSVNLASDIRAAIAYENGYDLGFIKPRLTATVNFGDKVDLEGLFEVEHDFSFFDDKLDVIPTVGVGGSTLNYYEYYRRRQYKLAKKKNQPQQTGIASVTSAVQDAGAFRLMDYEPSLPIEYTIGKCTINFTPAYAIPVNPATIDVQTVKQNGTITNSQHQEKISNTFFFTCEVSFLL